MRGLRWVIGSGHDTCNKGQQHWRCARDIRLHPLFAAATAMHAVLALADHGCNIAALRPSNVEDWKSRNDFILCVTKTVRRKCWADRAVMSSWLVRKSDLLVRR